MRLTDCRHIWEVREQGVENAEGIMISFLKTFGYEGKTNDFSFGRVDLKEPSVGHLDGENQ